MNKPLDYRLVQRNGRYYARLLDKETRVVIAEKSVSVLAQKVDMTFDGFIGGRTKKKQAEEVCKAFCAHALGVKPNEPRIIEYCLEYWNFDGERVTLENKKNPNAVARSSCVENLRNFNNHMKSRFESMGNPRISEITSKVMNGIQNDLLMNTKLRNPTIEKVMRSVITPLNDAYKHDLLDRPVRVDTLDTTPREKGILTQTQIAGIVRELYRLSTIRQHRGASEGVALASLTAMRMGEIRALTAGQIEIVNESDSIIHITQTYNDWDKDKIPKGKRVRQVVVPTVVARACLALAERNPHKTGRVFWTSKPDMVRSSSFFRSNLYQAMRNVGISEAERESKNITFHSLRHGFVTYIRHQVSDGTMRLAIGHRDKETTDRYTHLNMDNLRELAESTDRTFAEVIEVQNEIARK